MDRYEIRKALWDIDTEWLTYGKFYVGRDHVIGFIPKAKWLKDYFKSNKVGSIKATKSTIHASKYNGGQMFNPSYVQKVLRAVVALSGGGEVFIRVQGVIFIETEVVCGVIPNRRFEYGSILPTASDAWLGTETKVVDDGLLQVTPKKRSTKLPNSKLTPPTGTLGRKKKV
jgi:hypothetical protein